MSLNQITQQENFPISVKNISVQEDFIYDFGEIQPNRSLRLQRVNANFDEVIWENVNIGASGIYANQTDLIIRSASYDAITTDMYFDGFRYNRPPYMNLRDDKKGLIISSPGYYMAFLSVCSASPEESTEFRLTLDNVGIAGSFCATQPSRVAFGTVEQYVIASSACLFKVEVSNTLRLQIQPPTITSIVSDVSNLTIIRLITLPP